MSKRHDEALRRVDEIEREMRAAKLWQDTPLDPAQLQFTRAFASDTMAFPQWLQFVFLARVREIATAEGAFPPKSQVAAQAVRELDGVDCGDLIGLLSRFDQFIEDG